eukprot:NP_494051.1 Uncharacterized protein CELE_F45C12.9 [Caenorhabditis elegans]
MRSLVVFVSVVAMIFFAEHGCSDSCTCPDIRSIFYTWSNNSILYSEGPGCIRNLTCSTDTCILNYYYLCNLFNFYGIVCEDGQWYATKYPYGISYFAITVTWYTMDETVEGLLHIVDMYDSKMVTKNSEDFLIRTRGSKMTLKKKMQMADRYKLENLNV